MTVTALTLAALLVFALGVAHGTRRERVRRETGRRGYISRMPRTR